MRVVKTAQPRQCYILAKQSHGPQPEELNTTIDGKQEPGISQYTQMQHLATSRASPALQTHKSPSTSLKSSLHADQTSNINVTPDASCPTAQTHSTTRCRTLYPILTH